MKKSIVVLAILLTMASAAANAVDLQKGWYVCFGNVILEGYDGNLGAPYSTSWHHTSSLGQFGPFEVSNWLGYPSTRKITITDNVSVEPGVLFEDSGSYNSGGRMYSKACVSWETNYNADNIRFQLYRRQAGKEDQLVWQQAVSRLQRTPEGDGNIWESYFIQPDDQLVFKIVAVPEPMSLSVLACGASLLFCKFRRRRAS